MIIIIDNSNKINSNNIEVFKKDVFWGGNDLL